MSSAPVVSLVSYNAAMQTKIDAFSKNPLIREILAEKVNKIVVDKLRDKTTAADVKYVDEDFSAALAEFGALERHVFHIAAPPSLSPATLEAQSLPLSQNQSIMRQSVRSVTELLHIAKAFRVTNTIRGIIPLTIERLVMHNLTRRFILNFAVQTELSIDLQKVIKPLSARWVSEHLTFRPTLRGEIQTIALRYLEQGTADGVNPQLKEIVDKLLEQVSAEPSELSKQQQFEAVAMRAADLIIETYVKQGIDEYDIHRAPELAGYRVLPGQSKTTRRVFMINGGVASGKSSALAQEAAKAKAEGVEWETVSSINRDAFKPMLLQPGEVDAQYREFFASFAEDEAYLIRDAILREYHERLISDTAPHLHIDQVSPTVEMMRMAGDPTSQGLDLTIVYTPVELSLCMAHGREKETGYGAVTKGVLNTHANVPTQLLDSLDVARREGKTNIRLKIVANIARGTVAPVVHIDFAKAAGTVEDMGRLLLFFHKTHINRNAEKFEDLYDTGLPPPEKCCSPSVQQLMLGINHNTVGVVGS